MRVIMYSLVMLTLTLVADPVLANELGAGQPIMDAVISVLRQLMAVVIEFVGLLLNELVRAIQSLLPNFGFGGE